MLTEFVFYGSILIAGLLSFLSPCVLPLVPPYLCYLGGVGFDEISGDEKRIEPSLRRKIIISSVFFVLGFTTVFVGLGASATSFGSFLHTHKEMLAKIAGVIIILFGVHFLGLFRFGFLERQARFEVENSSSSLLGAYVMGLAFAFGWTPCVGPILAPILALASSAETVKSGILMLLVYSLGLGIPFILAAIAIGPFLKFRSRFSRYLGLVEKFLGLMLILTGILFFTGGLNVMGNWLLTHFPELGALEKSLVPSDLEEKILKKGQ